MGVMLMADRQEIGQYLYLWRRTGQTTAVTDCLITAHGGTTMINKTTPMRKTQRQMSPDLLFYVPHGCSTSDFGLSTFADRTPFEILKPAACPEYMLAKYTNGDQLPARQHNKLGESYNTIRYTRDRVDYDILTIRARYEGASALGKTLFGLPFSDVLDALEQAGHTYSRILCGFCRGGKTYAAEQPPS